jgi:TRAP-type C4-dicarboxylate transport system substrate-binding protein
MDAAIRYQRERAKLQEADSIAEIQKRGMTYTQVTPELTEAMRKATANVVDDVKKRAGADLVARVQTEVAKAK